MHQEKRLDKKAGSLKVGLTAVGITVVVGGVNKLAVSGGRAMCQ